MAEKNISARIVHKHDIEENWLKAVNFIPKQGEIIIYDIDDNYNYERMKIGDGARNVNDLPFVVDTVSANNQSDWSIHDEASPAYVKNRTHWSKISQTVVLPECQLEALDTIFVLRNKISIIIGHTYIVNWNGVSYTCVAGSFNGLAFIGNGRLFGVEDTGEPFLIGCYPDDLVLEIGYYAEVIPFDDSTTCTISIIEHIEDIQKLDNKYLSDDILAKPDWNASEGNLGHILNRTHYTEETIEEIIPETTVTFGDATREGRDTGTATGSAIQIYPEYDEVFVIEWNGIKYYSEVREYTKTDGSFGRGIGNTGMFGGGGYPRYPFLIGFLTEQEAATTGHTYFVWVNDESTTATFSVGKVGEAVHKLDAKYLPENIATEEYVDTAIAAIPVSRNKWTKVQDVTVSEEVGYVYYDTDMNGVPLRDNNYTKIYLFMQSAPQETASPGELIVYVNVYRQEHDSRPRASAGNNFIKSTTTQYWKALFDIDNALCLFGIQGIANQSWSENVQSTPDAYELFTRPAGDLYVKEGFINNVRIKSNVNIPVGTKIKIWAR